MIMDKYFAVIMAIFPELLFMNKMDLNSNP